MTAHETVVGTWKLASWTTEIVATKERFKLFGEHPRGYLHFTESGRTFAVLTADGRASVQNDEDQINAFRTLVAYSGRYRIEGNRLTTKVDVSADPAWVGIELVRYFTLEGDQLEIVTAPFVSPKPGHPAGTNLLKSFLSWHRE